MATRRPTAARASDVETQTSTTTEATPKASSRAISLTPGHWYIAAVDTGAIPVSMALDTIEEGLSGRGFGTLRFYRERSELPRNTPDEIAKLAASVWVSGQFVPRGGGMEQVTFEAPDGLMGVGELAEAPPKPAPIERATSVDDEVPTKVIVAAVLGVTVIGGGAILLAWWMKAKRKRKNGKKRRRKW